MQPAAFRTGFIRYTYVMTPDEELAAAVQKGQKEKFGILMERYEAKLFRYGKRFLSDTENIADLVQDIFIAAYRNLQSFDVNKKFSSWIYRIAHNIFVNALKRRRIFPHISLDLDTLTEHPQYTDPKELEREWEEMQNMVESGLAQLNEKYREVIILHYFESLSYGEIADVLHIPIGTVGVRLARARESLKKIYTK